MRRLSAVLAGLLMALALALVPTAATADTDWGDEQVPDVWGREVTRWDQTFTLQPDGSVDVVLEIDFDYGMDPGHGPYMVLPLRQGYSEGWDRVYKVSKVRASSPTGAPSKVYLVDERNWLTVRVGDENIGNVEGVQTYVISWTVDAVMNATTDRELGGDTDEVVGEEFYWNAVGDGWTIPISHATVTVVAPAEAEMYGCWAGPAMSTNACRSAESDGNTVTFTQLYLSPGQPFTVAALYPPGNFKTDPVLIESNDVKRAFRLTPFTVTASVLLLAAGIYLLARRLLNVATDREYAGLTPGLSPVGEMQHQERRRDYRAPIAVRYTPPDGMRPGQIGTLVDEKADPRDVTATLVDLAVRGYLRIEPLEAEKGMFKKAQPDYRLVREKLPDTNMLPYEMTLYQALFPGRSEVTLSQLKTTFLSHMNKVQKELYENVTELGWFRSNPESMRIKWFLAGLFITVFGFAAMAVLGASTSFALLSLPFVIVGVATMFTTKNAPARTAEGTRVLVQAQGFEHYLKTAEANQLVFEEGEDIFSKYLPYAIAFGVAEKWAKNFEQLAAQGVEMPEPTWLGAGVATGMFWSHSGGLASSLGQFASLAESSISAPTPGSSGGSGFSSGGGGGGFSGGGGGGGGGGGW